MEEIVCKSEKNIDGLFYFVLFVLFLCLLPASRGLKTKLKGLLIEIFQWNIYRILFFRFAVLLHFIFAVALIRHSLWHFNCKLLGDRIQISLQVLRELEGTVIQIIL